VTLEKHCAAILSINLRDALRNGDAPEIATFVSSRPRHSSPGYRAFNLGLESCGRLAVVRLAELQRNPKVPFSRSSIYSPGWDS